MPPTLRFPDVQRLLLDGLEGIVGSGHVAIETPDDLEEQMPFVRVRRGGGHSDHVTDYPTVDIDVFAALYPTAQGLAEDIRDWLVGPPPPIPRIDHAQCTAAPQELPWDAQSPVRRIGATYRLQTRRQPL